MSKVAIITGASKGIGASTAIAFGNVGYDVVVNYRTDTKKAQEVVNTIVNSGQKAVAIQADVSKEEEVKKLFAEVQNHFSSIDVLVNNAGNADNEATFGEYKQSDIKTNLEINFGSALLCSQEVVKFMDKGSILFTSSIYGLSFGGNPNLLLYSAGKAAIINLAQTLSEKLSPNIRCNVVAPGSTRTPAWDGIAQEYVDRSLSMTLQKEWVEPEEIAGAFVFLAEAPHMTGQTIVVDAGWQKKIR